MIKMIHTASIVALLVAGLTLARCLAGWYEDSHAQQAATPTATERFRQSCRDSNGNRDPRPPLIEQAQAYARYLNPPRTPGPAAPAGKPQAAPVPETKSESAGAPVAQVQPAASSPKFELHGISYYRQRPEQSMALVLEPGGRRRWVHPGEQVGHLTIERIDGNAVVCREGTQTQVIALVSKEAITPYARTIKGAGPVAAPKQARNQDAGPEVPPPAPGIRPMPQSRVATLLGQPS